VQRLWFAGALLGAAALLNGNLGFACGDKLLSIGRGIRFQHAYGARQANVVIYFDGNQSGSNFASAKLQTTLRQAGHKLHTAAGLSQLQEALKSGKVDVVLADFADVAGISGQLQSAPSKPVIFPVLFKRSKAELSAAQKEYGYALKAPGDEVQYLVAIDEAMKSRLKAGAKS
jgi:ABC-type amino acid transport substrate-binding protein